MAADTPTGERAASALPSQLFGVDRTVFTRLLDAAPDAMLVVDHEGRIVVANVQAEGLFAATRAMLCERGIEDLLPERFRQVHAHHRQRYFRQPRVRAMGSGQELLGQRLDGSEFPVEVSLSPLDTDAGHWVVAAIRDISARKEVEHALAARNEELEQFSYIASHDLQAPLRTLMSFAQLLKADCGDDLSEDASQYLAFIDRGAQQMQGLIQGLLLYSRAGRFDTDYAATELEPIWQQVRAQQKKAIEASQAQVESAPLPSWPVAPDGLQMLLAALLDNALKYPAEGEPPRVELRATIEGDTLQLEMRDHGRGLPEDLREAAFEPFRRVHSDAGLPGAGLGLATARRIAERHGGRIWAEAAEGGGTRILCRLPEAPG